ncbi:DNA polymerase III subunit epsilon [Salinisphaera sp. USBA-960]|uniref:DNA polymerase III subunit epsilon n=1 Tax=Salinisphaera orenii TaxID=856731 RepID=UPI000DBE0485|nr:DNA polymerase III subunit epsilon [Salifodinibacter halophilus]NNC25441.1 DNA polymerase III subunit epsilon [Salifodinibacter halophilus]
MRQIVLDTETTGMDAAQGHRIIEIGCVELNNRRPTDNDLHMYIRPDCAVDPGAVEVHGITDEFLADKPSFDEIAPRLVDYLADAELVIHNAPFDLAFLDAELKRVDDGHRALADSRSIVDTLVDARERFPGQRNSLDALCKRFEVDNTNRSHHGALLDARLLADVYRAMTGGQIDFGLIDQTEASESGEMAADTALTGVLERAARRPRVVQASEAEVATHDALVSGLERRTGQTSAWRSVATGASNTTEH